VRLFFKASSKDIPLEGDELYNLLLQDKDYGKNSLHNLRLDKNLVAMIKPNWPNLQDD